MRKPTESAPGGWATPPEIAADLGISLRTVYTWLRSNKYRVRRQGDERRPLWWAALDKEGFLIEVSR